MRIMRPPGSSVPISPLNVLWALAPLLTGGLLTWMVIGSAAIRLESKKLGAVAFGYLALLVFAFTISDGVTADATTANDWQNTAAALIWFFMTTLGGTVHAFLLRSRVFRPRSLPSPHSQTWSQSQPQTWPQPQSQPQSWPQSQPWS